jgi:hypothetical protein
MSDAPRYRQLSPRSNVDETLFGPQQGGFVPTSPRDSPRSGYAQSPRSRRTSAARAGQSIISPRSAAVAVLGREELQRIMSSAVILSPRQEAAQAEEAAAARNARMAVANTRKQRMREKEALLKKSPPKSDIELSGDVQRAALLKMADGQRSENLDAVKLLNSLGSRAATFTMREAQLTELGSRREKERDYNIWVERNMELDRLKDLQRRELEERQKKERRLEDNRVLCGQIEDRRQEGIRNKQLQLDEQRRVKEAAAAAERADQEKQEQQRVKAAELMEEVSISAFTRCCSCVPDPDPAPLHSAPS